VQQNLGVLKSKVHHENFDLMRHIAAEVCEHGGIQDSQHPLGF
jgi:hypothetical protein